MTDTLMPVEFKTISDTGEIEGYASTFGNRDLVGDIVQPGAFTKSLAGRVATDVLMLWGHDHKRLIGVWTEIGEDTIGLRVKGRIMTETRDGAEAFAFAKAGPPRACPSATALSAPAKTASAKPVCWTRSISAKSACSPWVPTLAPASSG